MCASTAATGATRSAVAASTGSSRAAEFFVAGGAKHVVPRHQDGRARGAHLLGKDIALFDARVRGSALPELLDRAARTGLRLFTDAAEAERHHPTTTEA